MGERLCQHGVSGRGGVSVVRYTEHLVHIFTRELGVVEVGASCLRIISYTYVLFAFGMVVTQAFNGAGAMWTPTWINFFCAWIVQLPLAYALAFTLDWGVDGVFAAIAVGQGMMAVVGVLVFRRGRWKVRVV